MVDETNPFLLRLRQCAELDADDEAWICQVTADARPVAANQDLKSHGEDPREIHVILDGLACRYKVLPDGQRQIVAFLVPGDPCDFHAFLPKPMDHGIATLAPSMVATIDRAVIEAATRERPVLTRAFWASTMMDEAILREWLVNIGRRDAYARVAHLLWELYLRHAVAGKINGTQFKLPLTQSELADALGLSGVHINRTLQRLKTDGIIAQQGRTLQILRPAALQQISGFDPDYLHYEIPDADGELRAVI